MDARKDLFAILIVVLLVGFLPSCSDPSPATTLVPATTTPEDTTMNPSPSATAIPPPTAAP
jgi:hypothetical protein